MREFGKIYKPEDFKRFYEKVTPVYQVAFAGEPWFEVSKCEDQNDVKRCVGGISSRRAGERCEKCGNCLSKPAYESEELAGRFDRVVNSRRAAWYMEENGRGAALVAFAWRAEPAIVLGEKYSDVSEMGEWMRQRFGDEPVMWLDEVFADRLNTPNGNLYNFGRMCRELAGRLNAGKIAYRTIATPMIKAAEKAFPSEAEIYTRNREVPDRRDFVIINAGGTK